MAENADPKDTTAAPAADPIKNVKEEFNRKIGNFETQFKTLMESNQALAQRLESMQKPVPKHENTRSWKERFYEDEDAAVAEIQQKATEQALDVVNKVNQREQAKQATMGQLVVDYPELADPSADLRKRAVEIHDKLSPEEKQSPYAYKLAVREAAAELGVLPKSKRKEKETDVPNNDDDDSFQVGGNNGNAARQADKRKQKEDKLSDETLQFAELLGRPVDDEKYIARLKAANERKNWAKYNNQGLKRIAEASKKSGK